MKFFSLLTAASAALATESGLNVRLEYAGGTSVKVIATNNGQETLKLLNLGTLFDDHSPVRKVSAEYANGAGANFTGVQVHPARQFLTENSFTQIQPGKTYQSTVDMAEIYDLRSGGRINIKAQGNTPLFDADLKPAGMIEHTSNTLSIEIDPHAAVEAHKKRLAHKRAYTDQSCPSDRAATVAGAISDCYTYAYWSKQEALYGRADRMQDFFKADDQSTRQKVGEVFDAVMKECQNGPKSDVFCLSGPGQKYRQCPDGVVAYTHFDSLDIQLCDIWFTRYDARTRYCHGADRASLFLHETTHATKGTQDLAYFYENVIKLPTDKALINADTYALFAQDSWGFCDGKPKRYQVYACNDVNFGGRCFGIQGSLGTCANIDPAFDNQSSSLGGTSLGDCTVYRDYDCKGPSFKLAQSQQMNSLPDGFNDQISSVYC